MPEQSGGGSGDKGETGSLSGVEEKEECQENRSTRNRAPSGGVEGGTGNEVHRGEKMAGC